MFELFNDRQRRRRFRLPKDKLAMWSTIAMGAFALIAGGVIFVALLFVWYAKDLPRPDKVVRTTGLSTVVLDRNGISLYDIFQGANRIPVLSEDIPKYLKEATVAVEDKDFYKHQGLSATGIVRGMVACIILRRCQGGSTLTQQLVKNVLLTQERTLPRKMKEAILSIQIERKYSKDEILQMYLNEAPYGGTAVGVEAASELYFGKKAKDLTLTESAILAGLPQSPSQYSPFGSDPKAFVWRTQQVLRRMREDGYITPLIEADSKKQLDAFKFYASGSDLRAPHFVAYIKDQLVTMFGQKMVDAGGMTVTTTLDWKLQEKAQSIVKEEVDKDKYLKVSNGAAVVIDPKTGEILTMVGSKDYSSTDSGGYKFNVVTQGLRQPGSSLKPITYAAAFKKGYTASTVLMDVDTKYPSGDPVKPEYNPKNYDNKFRGPTQLRFALANSINTVAVKVSALVGVKDILTLASDMGLTSLEPTAENISRIGLSLTLGGGEVHLLDLTSAFGVFATGGMHQDPVSILKVTDSKAKTIYEHKTPTAERVLGADISFLISNILSDNDARKDIFGLNSYLYIAGKSVAVKTGTTDDKRDNWTIGYTPGVVVGTWVGNNDNSPMNPALASGVTGAAPIWNRIIREILATKSDEPFVKPDNVNQVEIDSFGGGLPLAGGATRKEYFIKGTEPTDISPIYSQIKVSKKDNNKLANQIEIAKGEYDLKSFVVFKENDPVSTDGKNRWQAGIDAWIAGQGDSKYHPPTEVYSGPTDQMTVEIREPGDKAQVNDNNVRIRVDAVSVNNITKVQIYVDGTLVRDTSDKSINDTFSMSTGQHSINVKASDDKGNNSDRTIHIGVNQPYSSPTPAPTP